MPQSASLEPRAADAHARKRPSFLAPTVLLPSAAPTHVVASRRRRAAVPPCRRVAVPPPVLTHVASRRAHSPPQLGKKQLAGKRCRLTAGPSKEDLSKVSAAVSIDVENSFANAEAVQQACGWEVIKGYAVYELEDALGTFVAHKRWWNQKPTGVWVDVTPRVASATTELVLLESALGAKTPIKMSDAVREGAKARLAMGGFAIGVPPSDRLPPAPAPLPASSPVATKPKPKPPPTPPKLEFKGSESLEELVQLLTKGSSHAQVRAAAALAAQAATGPTESQRIVSAGGLQPLLLLLRREGEVQEHAARAIMSLADCMEHQKQITVAGAIPAVVQLLQGATPAVQDTAAGILGNLAIQNPANQAAIVAAGALPPLVNLLLKGSSPAKEQACFALWNLACQHPDNQLAIEQAAAIKPLVALLSKGSAALQEEAAGALMNLAAHPDNKRAIAGAEAIAPLVEMLKAGGGPAEQAAGCLMNLASNNAENQRLILKASALPPLLTLLKDKGGSSRRAREYVAGALMNLALKQPATQAEIAKGGAIPLLVEMLGDKEGLMEEVAGALTNLADTNEDNQEAIGKAGAVAPLIKLLGSGVPKSGQEEAAGTLMNLAASEANKAKMVSAGVLGPLLALLSTGTVATQEHAAGCLANLANGHDEHQTAIIKAGAIEPLLSLLSVTGGGEPGAPHGVAARASSALLLLCLRKDGADAAMRAGGVAKLTTALERGVSEAAGALMNLALHSADAQQAILTGGALPLLVEMLSAGTPAGQEEAAGAIMNLVTNAPHNQKPVADAGAVLPLVMLLSFGGTPTAKEQAAAALGNLALGNAPLRKAIVGAQACPPLVEMLKGAPAADAASDKGAKKLATPMGKTTGGGPVEASNCLRILLEGDAPLQAELVEEGILPLAAALLKHKASAEAATRLLGVFDECFDDLIAAAKK